MRISDWSSDVCSSDLCRAQALETLAVDGLERVAHRRDHARDAGGDERVGAGPGAAGVRARFEGDVGGGALRAVTSLLQREHFRVRPAMALVPAFAHHLRSEEHTSELQSLMRISYAVFCLKQKNK